MRRLRVGVIGCGRMGRERLRTSRTWGADIAAVYDPDPQRAAEASAPVLRYPEELARAGCDAVFICTPPNQRTSHALVTIGAGAALFFEKPVGVSAAGTHDISAALARTPVLNAVGYMNRYRISVQHVSRLLTGRDVIGLTGHWVCRSYGVPWWKDTLASGGPHNEQATHLYDLCRYLVGEVSEVRSIFHHPGTCSPSLAAATALGFESGATGTLFYSCQAVAKDISFRVFTATGSVALSGWDLQLTENTIDGTSIEGGAGEDIFLTETTAFLDAVATGDASLIRCNWFDAVRTQVLVDAAAASPKEMSFHAG